MEIRSLRDLRVWQAGIDLAENVYRLSETFPRRLETHLEIARRLRHASHEGIEGRLHEAGSLGKQRYALRNAIRRKGPERPNRNPKR
jgi:hypothetical protein